MDCAAISLQRRGSSPNGKYATPAPKFVVFWWRQRLYNCCPAFSYLSPAFQKGRVSRSPMRRAV
jgi:hypothetical protein